MGMINWRHECKELPDEQRRIIRFIRNDRFDFPLVTSCDTTSSYWSDKETLIKNIHKLSPDGTCFCKDVYWCYWSEVKHLFPESTYEPSDGKAR